MAYAANIKILFKNIPIYCKFVTYNPKNYNDETNCSSDGRRSARRLCRPGFSTGGGNSINPKVFWDGGRIPDPAFRAYVLDKFDTDRDGTISRAEAEAVTEINIAKVSSVDGIEKFTQLKLLSCINSELVSLDLSKNSALTGLLFYECLLTSLDVSKNAALTDLLLMGTQLSVLDISNNSELTKLYCSNNRLTTLDISRNKKLKELYCGSNPFTTLDLSQNTQLTHLECSENKLTALDLSKNTALTSLDWSHNPHLLLDLSGFPNLTELNYSGNGLTALNLSNNRALTKLDCSGNKLMALDLSNNRALTELDCSGNKLMALDLSNNHALTKLNCLGNNLTALDLSNNRALTKLNCSGNELAVLDLSNNRALTELNCLGNNLTALDLSTNNALATLSCGGYKSNIVRLDLSCNPELKTLYISEFANIGTLNLSNLSKLESFGDKIVRINNIVINGKTKIPEILDRILWSQRMKRQVRQQQREAEAQQLETARAEAKQKAAEYKRQIMPYLASKDWAGADRFAAEALAELPEGDAFLYLVRAKAYFKQNLDFEVSDNEDMTEYFRAYRSEAERLAELCRKSIVCDSSDGNEAYFYRGMAYIVLGRADDAAADFKRCARGNEALKAVCYYNIGTAYKNAGRYSPALEQFKLARQYYTDADKKEQCLQRIKECQQKIKDK